MSAVGELEWRGVTLDAMRSQLRRGAMHENLVPSELRLAVALMTVADDAEPGTKHPVPRQSLREAVTVPDRLDPVSDTHLKVVMCNLRDKFRVFGMNIVTVKKNGSFLRDERS